MCAQTERGVGLSAGGRVEGEKRLDNVSWSVFVGKLSELGSWANPVPDRVYYYFLRPPLLWMGVCGGVNEERGEKEGPSFYLVLYLEGTRGFR